VDLLIVASPRCPCLVFYRRKIQRIRYAGSPIYKSKQRLPVMAHSVEGSINLLTPAIPSGSEVH
jgi:hypothetical protein